MYAVQDEFNITFSSSKALSPAAAGSGPVTARNTTTYRDGRSVSINTAGTQTVLALVRGFADHYALPVEACFHSQ